MKKTVFVGTFAATALVAGLANAQSTLEQVIDRGELICGSNTGQVGFGAPDADGVWQGFDVGFCRAVAAAIFDDPMAVSFVPLTSQTRFSALASGEVDVLSRNTTWTFVRDVDLQFNFAGINYYDGQGFMVKSDLGVGSAMELDGATVCIETGTTTELNLADFFRVNGMSYEPVPVDTAAEAQQQYLAGACDVYTTDVSALASSRASFATPSDHTILPEVVSKEPLGPAVRHGDDNWYDIIKWTLMALVAAEELGVTSENVAELAEGSDVPEINRLLGVEGGFGAMLGLDNEWAARAIAAVGNYGELFANTIGDNSPIGLERGMNALFADGGMMYAMPFR